MFNALVVEKDEDGKTSAAVQRISEADLPEAEVTVAVEYSTVNYKDGLCIGPGAGWCGQLAACAGDRLRRARSRHRRSALQARATRWC
jgi:hypothetical protein